MHESKKVNGYEVVIGIDWADEKNDLWIMDKKRAQGEHRQVAQGCGGPAPVCPTDQRTLWG